MVRRKELKNIASGLYGSFISRNNDVGGYWGIGKLCLLAQQRKTTVVEINLLTETIAPESPSFAKLLSDYHVFLQEHLAARNIQPGTLASAKIELNFSPDDHQKKHIPARCRGNLFKLSVAITDDRNTMHTVSGYSYCEPHNPNRESQSTRIHETQRCP